MTLIVALEGKDGLLLAADSRGTIGDPRGLTAINDTLQKNFDLSKYCAVGVSGAAELSANLINELKIELKKKNFIYLDQIYKETRRVIRKNYNDWFERYEVGKGPVVSMTLVGLEKEELKKRIFLFTSQFDFAPQLCVNGYMLSGIPQYATYLIHRFYDREMKLDHLIRLSAYLITETATQDTKVGGPVRIMTITEQDGFKELDEETINSVIQENSEQNQKLREFFIKGG